MQLKYLLLSTLVTVPLIAGQLEEGFQQLKIDGNSSRKTPQPSTPVAAMVANQKEDAECKKLGKLLERLPSELGLHIISFAINQLHKVKIFEEFVLRKYRTCHWIPIETRFALASGSTIREFEYTSESSCSRRKQKITEHESVTKKLVEQFYKARATRKAP